MTDAEIVQMMREHFEGLFPKTCQGCGRCYTTLGDYVLNTKPTGPTISYDAELRDWRPTQPIGAIAAVNCSCGTTLALSTAGMPLPKIHAVLAWVQTEMARRGQDSQQVIGWVRDQIRQQVMARSESVEGKM
jgi:hypothetical protein